MDALVIEVIMVVVIVENIVTSTGAAAVDICC